VAAINRLMRSLSRYGIKPLVERELRRL
jgi:hypothetical protein